MMDFDASDLEDIVEDEEAQAPAPARETPGLRSDGRGRKLSADEEPCAAQAWQGGRRALKTAVPLLVVAR